MRDEAGGSGLASCSGERASGAPVDTATPGSKTFTVRSKDRAGNEGSTTIRYYVSNYPTLPSSVSMKYVYGSSAASIKIKRLLVSRAPKGARIAVRCHGEGCPKSKHRPLVMAHDGQVVLRRWKGTELRPGETFKVSITKPLSTGVRFAYRVGRGHKVAKRVLCLPPGEKATKC